jgi:hypothetical protein
MRLLEAAVVYLSNKFSALVLVLSAALCISLPAAAQQTLGGITGTVVDATGSAVPNVEVKVVSEGTKLVRTAKSNGQGEYQLNDLPIGTYTVTFTITGFTTEKVPGIVVQSDRMVTLPAKLAVGATTDSVTVTENPLLNATDTTNGYVLDRAQIEAIPLPTGSFTGVAILSPGVNAELPGGTGANSGLGNAPIWANGQRDTSNSFSLNGVDGSSLFNGKSTSQVASARVVNSTGAGNDTSSGVIQSSSSVYLSIGNAIPTPAPETIQEIRVNASMYDAQQGSTSGAHIDLSTSSGTNVYHGTLYGHRGTNWINAAPFFFKNDGDIPEDKKNPALHRYIVGGTIGGPIIKDKLFGFFSYQHLQVADEEIGDSFFDVPVGLSDDRSASAIAAVTENAFDGESTSGNPFAASDIDPTALALLNIPAVPGESGKYLVPSDCTNGVCGSASISDVHPADVFLPGTGRFKADMAVADLDYNATSKDTIAVKYYYQHDPTLAPYGWSNVPGFATHMDSGAQVFSLSNTYLIKSNLSTTQTVGFLREKTYATNDQPFGPANVPGCADPCINAFGSTYFPGVTIINVLGSTTQTNGAPSEGVLNIGPNAGAQGSNTGAFQNRIQPSANAIWSLGKHTISFGGSYSYTQLNTIDKRGGTGTIVTDDFSGFAQGFVSPGGPNTDFDVTSFLQGNASRYYRANQVGLYLQDKFQVTPTLSLTAGVRYDWDGGLTEKYGRLFNFDPSLYSYDDAADEITNPGFIIAGNNANGTKGVSPTTLTGRQWGVAPRLGAAWQPALFKSKVVVRAGAGIYYDRGELFSYFSPGYAEGTVAGGPFGVNQQLPFVNSSTCPTGSLYSYYIPTCGGSDPYGPPTTAPSATTGNLANPYTNTLEFAAPSNPQASDLAKYLPNVAGLLDGQNPISLGTYDRANKLPYTMNYTLDIQWQPRSDLAVELGYVGNLGRHQVIPVPFNQPVIANATSPTLAGGANPQIYTYGYELGFGSVQLPDGSYYLTNSEGGNVDLRVPYIGYAAESIDYKAAGIDAYNALQAHIEKRMSHGIQIGASYTYSHALDEQSGLGLFYNGNNPLNLRDGYASSDFDRTHVLNFNYVFRLPDLVKKHSVAGYFADGWSLVGLTVIQSGQPYSIIDYTGAVGSIYYSTQDGITNPIVPLAAGCTAKSAKTGASGAFFDFSKPFDGLALKASCFTLPLLAAGSYGGGTTGGGIPINDPYETGFTKGQRNIFRQSFQKRGDASLVKVTKFSDRYSLKYTFDVYNLTNTSSFDVPGDNVSQNYDFNNGPGPVGTYTSVLPQGDVCSTNPDSTIPGGSANTFYTCPIGLGLVTRTIGSPRQIQMSLSFLF